MRNGFLIYEEMRKYFPIYEEEVSHICMTLQLLHSELPYIWGKFYFLFYQCWNCKKVMGGCVSTTRKCGPASGEPVISWCLIAAEWFPTWQLFPGILSSQSASNVSIIPRNFLISKSPMCVIYSYRNFRLRQYSSKTSSIIECFICEFIFRNFSYPSVSNVVRHVTGMVRITWG